MSDTSTQTDHQEAVQDKGSEQQTAERTFTQADVDRIVGERLARQKEQFGDYDDLRTAAAELKEIKDANKSDQQKAQDQIASLTQQLNEATVQVSTLTLENLRASVAATKGVPAGRLRGTTKEEIEADADAYLAEIASRDAGVKRTKPPAATGLKSGASSTDDTSANPQDRAAAMVREWRRTSGA